MNKNLQAKPTRVSSTDVIVDNAPNTMPGVIMQTQEEPTDQVAVFIQSAIEKGLPVETMEKLFALHREAKADHARGSFVTALSKFQKDIPVITKNKKVLNKDGQTVRYQYASLDGIADQIKDALTNNGLSYTWDTENKENIIRATCTVMHKFGHSQTSTFEIPIEKSQYMTAPQSVASALTFAKRYTLCNALGISTSDEDTDATDVAKQPEAVSPKSRIVFALRALGQDPMKWDNAKWTRTIKEMVGLDLTDANLPEIATRLGVLLHEKNDENPTIQE